MVELLRWAGALRGNCDIKVSVISISATSMMQLGFDLQRGRIISFRL
ncbi:hypothetical protein ACFQ0M_01235 [Kitasatospora aburaviensis]